ncbi:hypothetical protein G9A89_020254 [Geosiphon pyriformis]|nr:hypothetical protein G9A89_020254 [Geosiphon pyriformis]
MTKGEITVHVEEARNLKDEDVAGKSDPYVELWIEKGYKQKTSTKTNTITPKWDEKFTFNVDNDPYLYLKVLDSDVGDDDKIGETKVDLKEVYQKRSVGGWYKLPALLGFKSNGEIRLHISYKPLH